MIVSNFTSLDGFVAGLGGDVMALPFDPSFDAYNLERIRNADTLLSGRTTPARDGSWFCTGGQITAADALAMAAGRVVAQSGRAMHHYWVLGGGVDGDMQRQLAGGR